MKFILLRAKKFRHAFFEMENKFLALIYIRNNKSLSNAVRWKASLLLSKFKASSRSKLFSRCSLTGRSRSFLKLFRLSRLKFRELARDGKLPFVKKVSW